MIYIFHIEQKYRACYLC